MSAPRAASGQVDPTADFTHGTFDSQGTKPTSTTVQEHAAGLAQAAKNNASAALNSVQNSQFAQDLANGPAAQSVMREANATGDEFSDLANSRKMPEHTAANNTPLTHYHSFFFNLLSWRNPRATSITFAAAITFIFATRYLPLVRLALKGLWTVLGVVTLAEVAAKYTIGSSVANSVRPRRYYKIPKETLEATLDDVEQLINFFVIEFQRIVFAEHIPTTAAAFVTAFTSYYLVKLLPGWGFALFATSVIFLVPLVYTQNKEFIDSQYEHATNVVVQQTEQLKTITAEQTSKSLETVKAYTGDYANLASEYIGKSRQKIPAMPGTNGATQSTNSVKSEDFPQAPKTDFASSAEHTKPIVTAPGDGQPIAASVQ